MTITLAELRAQCRAFLTSETVWPDAKMDIFINDGIRHYSNSFPRRLRYSLALTTGTQGYALPGGHGFVRLAAVEYPGGEDPPVYLQQVNPWAAAFANQRDVFAVETVTDDVAGDVDTAFGQIVFAQTVTTGEVAVLTYEAVHSALSSDTDVVTVPDTHIEAIIAFVDFRAHWERETDQTFTGSSSSLVLSQMGENGRRAWNRYREVIAGLSPVGGWTVENPAWGDVGL